MEATSQEKLNERLSPVAEFGRFLLDRLRGGAWAEFSEESPPPGRPPEIKLFDDEDEE